MYIWINGSDLITWFNEKNWTSIEVVFMTHQRKLCLGQAKRVVDFQGGESITLISGLQEYCPSDAFRIMLSPTNMSILQESWPIWRSSTRLPEDGDLIIYWVNEGLRDRWHGFFWSEGTFRSSSSTDYGVMGCFAGNLEWIGVDRWAQLDDVLGYLVHQCDQLNNGIK